MRLGISLRSLVFVSALAALLVVSSAAQQIRFEDFSSISGLQLNGSPHQATWQGAKVLRLTDGGLAVPHGAAQASATYFNVQQPLTSGFTTWFAFQLHNPTLCCNPGDGISFIIQNSTAQTGCTDGSYGASGCGLTALGAGAGPNQSGAMGYAGISNNLAVEFDIHQDAWDPNSSHVAVQTCGTGTNTPVHMAGSFEIGTHQNVPNCLYQQPGSLAAVPPMGGNCAGITCTNGAVHQVVIEYTPPAGHQPNGTLMIWLDPPFLDGTHTPAPSAVPIINVPYNVTSLNLNNGAAWVGFTASQPMLQGTQQDILGWEFTPHSPTQITQVIPPGGQQATYPFGSHQMAVTYPAGFTNPDQITMTVLATPVNQQTFFTTRLLGTQFANEACAIYLGTGTGNCLVYSVTCFDPVTGSTVCPQEPLCSPQQQDQCIDIDSTFYTSSPISPTNADFLEAEPIGSNNWMSIFFSYTTDPVDGTVSGKGKGFSDIVTTFIRNKP
jgi:hypothetical protein